MKSFAPAYLEKIVIPQRLSTTIRLLGEYKGKQKNFLKDGGLRERMTRARLQARDEQKKGRGEV